MNWGMKEVYFISDAHLGSRALSHTRQQERRLCSFLDSIKDKAQAVYMLGDMFDFWYEYRTVVPKGFTRFLGKLSELTDSGVEVHLFTGNHDLWCGDYLTEECGVQIHRQPATVEIADKVFYLAHGDGLGDNDWKFRILRSIFHNRWCQFAFSLIHPDLGVEIGLRWAKHSREKHEPCLQKDDIGFSDYKGEDEENLVRYAKQYIKTHTDVNYLMFGHRHIELDLVLSQGARLMILGDWITRCSYAVWNGEHMYFENYVEGDV